MAYFKLVYTYLEERNASNKNVWGENKCRPIYNGDYNYNLCFYWVLRIKSNK